VNGEFLAAVYLMLYSFLPTLLLVRLKLALFG